MLSGIIKDPKTKQDFKIIRSSDTLDSIVFSSRDFCDFYRCQLTKDSDILANILEKDDDSSVLQLLQNMEDARKDQNKVSKEDAELNWKHIADKYVTTFPLRGIGSLQWSRSKKNCKTSKEK